MTGNDLSINPGNILAAANLSTGLFIGFDGDICGAGEKSAGVCKIDTAQGSYAPIQIYGIEPMQTGGAFDVGDDITSDSQGRAVKASSVAISVAVPTGETAVTSTAAQPNLTETVTGGSLPEKINGQAFDASTGAGKWARIILK